MLLQHIIQFVVIVLVVIVVIVILLRRILFHDFETGVTRLNAIHEDNLIKESQLTEELKRAKEERDAEVQKGKDEAVMIVEEAKKEAIRMKLKMQEEARAQCDKIIQQGKQDLENFREKIRKEMQLQSLDLAVEMIKMSFTEENKKDLQIQFVNEILAELEKLPRERFSVSAKEIKVISSYPLIDSQKENLNRILVEKIGFQPKLEESVDAQIISGFILEMQGLVIDGTLKNRLRQVLSFMKPSLGD